MVKTHVNPGNSSTAVYQLNSILLLNRTYLSQKIQELTL
ncbi:MAG: hypothetical protein MAG581_02260 [Deltaproteobacteria bacterium]|nr:hypothetical protein [Deltaproteobacteria bacterium]